MSISRYSASALEMVAANEFEKRESLDFCRKLFLSLKDETYAHVIDANTEHRRGQRQRDGCRSCPARHGASKLKCG